MPGRRLFIAVPLAEEARARIVDLVDQLRAAEGRGPRQGTAGRRGVRWVRLDGLHLTLHFLGPTEEPAVPAVIEATRRAAGATEPFELTIDGAGGFPDAARPRALWLGVVDGTTELADLARVVERELGIAGWPPAERPFRPHLTLARSDGVPGAAEIVRRMVAAAAGLRLRSVVDRLVLYESITGGGPARYEPLEVVPLRLHRPSPPR